MFLVLYCQLPLGICSEAGSIEGVEGGKAMKVTYQQIVSPFY